MKMAQLVVVAVEVVVGVVEAVEVVVGVVVGVVVVVVVVGGARRDTGTSGGL